MKKAHAGQKKNVEWLFLPNRLSLPIVSSLFCNEDKLGKGESYREKIVYFASLSIRNQFEVHLGSDFHLSKGDFFFFLFSWILDALNLRWH